MSADLTISPFTRENFLRVSEIYKAGLDTGIATFETAVPSYEEWNERFLNVCRFCAFAENTLVGWAALSPRSKRSCYSGVAEVTIYLDPQFQGKGFGKKLLAYLITASEREGFWTVTAHIFPENKASIALHEKLGFRVVGQHERIAQRNGKWHGNVILERRSDKV